jgi:hypothetical protein
MNWNYEMLSYYNIKILNVNIKILNAKILKYEY